MFRYLVEIDSKLTWAEVADDIYLNTTNIDNFELKNWKKLPDECTSYVIEFKEGENE